MTDHWGWVHIHGATVQFSARTYPTSEEARAGLQDHLDDRADEAAQQLRDLPVHAVPSTGVHLPGHTWRVQTSHEVRIFTGDGYRTYRRPSEPPSPEPTRAAPAKERRVSMMTESLLLRRVQVVGGLIMLGGVGAAFSGNFEGDRGATLLLFPLGVLLLVSPVILDLTGLRPWWKRRGR
ncbi:hypothetical protein [Streptomyces sp. NBC_01012]|uniref:hypothetical protein n=1 Tax=Streptomyces sp. NBC_01012 TaxID=2903717 RepID=UPI00386B01EB|nr:hypothetical protein OG623_10420 [Streptomyces sp. NBC_01012]